MIRRLTKWKRPELNLLAQHFLLIVAVVLLTNLAWSIVLHYASIGPRSRELGQLAISSVNLVRAALLASDAKNRQALLIDLSSREGIRVSLADPNDRILQFPFDSFFDQVRRVLRTKLSNETQIAEEINGISGFWVSFDLNDSGEHDYWLMLPSERAEISYAWSWTGFGILASFLALVGAVMIARKIAKPLANMAEFVADIGQSGLSHSVLEISGAQELQTLAKEINRMNEDLLRNERERAEMLAGISHDLRTPLTRLRLEVEMSITNDKALEATIADIEQIESIIKQFLEYARSEREEKEEWLSPLELFGHQVKTRQMRGEMIEYLVENINEASQVYLRPKAIIRMLNNLLDNAKLYAGGKVILHLGIEQQTFIIQVADQGPGIPEHEVERVLRPFTRLESARTNATGTGLGLAIVDRIVKIHQGKIQLLPNTFLNSNHGSDGLLVKIEFPDRAK